MNDSKKYFESITDSYGKYVFSRKNMQNFLSDRAFNSLMETIENNTSIVSGISDEVADAMKAWALEKGATHFTHWFQPLTGATAEKHDSFIFPDREGGILLKFSGQELVRGEPDASSLPSGGLRTTFEARGYTAWDPRSPAFIKKGGKSSTLCIPTAFYSYTGEALDKKVPLLRSIDALIRQIERMGKIFGVNPDNSKAKVTLGPEQEYFLVDRYFYEKRIDLLQTGRTLFGKTPAKHQQMDDHYFGAVKERVMNYMEEVDRELWKLGIPAKTRHNEVCPAQFELAPVYEELNLSVDHNMLTMQIMKEVAERHNFICLLHEKPFAGVNGSGKHINWSIQGPDGRNWLNPGDNPHENAKFLTIICTLMKAVDTHAGLLRASVASAGNDHRLGANEAPPAILSIFLGEQLTDIIRQIEKGGAKSSKAEEIMELGITTLPKFIKDVTDRNRTSPFAFTGNKFEFRAVGASQSCASSALVLNTIVADSLDKICTRVEDRLEKGESLNHSLQKVLQEVVKKHNKILFNGNSYTGQWREEAKKRRLPRLKTTAEALKEYKKEKTVNLFERHNILSKEELFSRYEIYKDQYEGIIRIEAEVALDMARTLVLPAGINYRKDLSVDLNRAEKNNLEISNSREFLTGINKKVENLQDAINKLDTALKEEKISVITDKMKSLREIVDELETSVSAALWPLPSYAEMMFLS